MYKVKHVLENREGRYSGQNTNRSLGKSAAGNGEQVVQIFKIKSDRAR